MSAVAQLAALLAAVAYLSAAPVEMFFVDRPAARRFLHVQIDNLDEVRMWAFVVGFRNLLAGVAMLVGLAVLRAGDPTVGRTIVLTVAAYMLLASLAMGLADLLGHWRPRGGSVVGTIASSAPPLITLITAVP